MDMNHIRPRTDDFTNQHVLNIESVKERKNKALRDKHIVDSYWITLHLIFYKDSNEGTNKVCKVERIFGEYAWRFYRRQKKQSFF